MINFTAISDKKLSYRRRTARRCMLVSSCYVLRGMTDRFQSAKVTLKIIQEHWHW